jgi:stage II sporulation protein GA (sporulation sigma-E factor processing peptidase)
MLKELAVFCLTGFIFAGTSLGVTFLGVPFTVTRNGIMISDLPSGVTNVFLTVGIGYISVSILINSLRRVCDKVQDTYVSLYIEFDGQGLWIPALIDTGNELRDPLTGTPVIIVESSAVKSILCPDLRK